MKSLVSIAFLLSATAVAGASEADVTGMSLPQTPPQPPAERSSGIGDYAAAKKSDRVTFVAEKNRRGTSTDIAVDVVAKLCGDIDGCSVRIGMHNWDDTGRVASREFLFYYNARNHAWRASLGDPSGTDSDNVTQHINNSWACYFTDGKYDAWADKGDGAPGFGLLSWNQYNADCFLTIVD